MGEEKRERKKKTAQLNVDLKIKFCRRLKMIIISFEKNKIPHFYDETNIRFVLWLTKEDTTFAIAPRRQFSRLNNI